MAGGSIEYQDCFFALDVAIGAWRELVADNSEAALREDTDRGEILPCGASVERPLGDHLEQQGQCASGDAFAPMFAGDPVSDGIQPFHGETCDAADDGLVQEDDSGDDVGVAQALLPVFIEDCRGTRVNGDPTV